jgi:putative ABC transport system permease protein
MTFFRQIRAIVALNIRSIPSRLGTSSVVVIGIAGVVGVIVSVFAMTRGMDGALAGTGIPERAIVLRSGATSEPSSTLLVDAVATIKDAPGIARTADGTAAATGEILVSVFLERKRDGAKSGVVVRGVEPEAVAVRPEVRIVEGRAFTPGRREVIVGRSTNTEFKGLDVGDEVALRDSRWTVVGVFESGGDAHESGLLADSTTLRSAYQRTAVNSVVVRLESAAAFDTFKSALTTNPTLSVSVERESDYYRRLSANANGFFGLVTRFVGGVMALGALFAALNTMYSAVSARTVEIATLRAIGFGASGVVASVLVEALLLALLGAMLGAAAAWALFGGHTISMGNTTATLVFQMQVTPALLGLGMLWAATLGAIGGLFPALRAARLPVATALRAI